MDSRTAKRLILPAALLVTTFVSASSCKDPSREEYCGDIEKQEDCDSADGCGWNAEFGFCNSTCHLNETQAECEAIERCVWNPDGGSDSGGTETAGDGACEVPFT